MKTAARLGIRRKMRTTGYCNDTGTREKRVIDVETMSMRLTPFHVALQVRDIDEARHFYKTVLGCPEGRSAAQWADFNLYGHQLVCHVNPALGPRGQVTAHHNPVDAHSVPVPHCGVVLEMEDWTVLAQRLKDYGMKFVVEPYIRFAGLPGEQATLFLLDPSGNALEFKAFKNIAAQLFAT
jgi:extradiol dioxygenase family protein